MTQLRRSTAAGRPWVERTDLLVEALRTMKRNYAVAFLARVLYGASYELIAEKLHVSKEEAVVSCGIGASLLRHPSRSQRLRDVLDDSDEGALIVDKGLRDLIRSWHLEETFASLCRQCEQPMEIVGSVYENVGRPRRYCSNACRQRAYRARKRPGQTHGG
ncbi:hypothetical protein Shyd_82000 [Streptomyces hydrogenans]|uniref:RNA polymerase sigma factor 70 region 4 type 2 domain-containing protein n=2 Tax=Streptomyces hydrogenans TaxID=1873719 RepID=A0ABQ3PGU2_9ACTN|nr:hypothetical protein [Streptomyces hydrogenans]GHG35342.1 hypothetical protein GCM10018784_56010 [Streptomyces hydrogenans]GHI20349.1 hypothetical protein Shyd_17200 [Streptomyces hydrogenans]GHI20472.1 hypothetical protein Shyd_18430 [Streptomyces hydrogenans]GHI20483.1 hypothetical protein Shyd_18540 [Streptomyces hydrogenans]GHI22943.1 hypothetical protein Shyd_43140 [Streptomyces hydrogenans]